MYGFSWLFDARGVAVKHFLWPVEAMQAVKRAIRLFMLVYVPTVFVALMNSAVYAPHVNRESLGRIAFIFGMVALSLFVWRLFRRSGPVMQALLPESSRTWPARLYPLWANALIALPIALGLAAAAGFYFAAGILYRLTMATLLLVLAAVVVYGMIALWVLIQRARLSRRQAAQSEEHAVQVVSEDGTTLRPLTLDVHTLGERTSHLLNLVTTLLLLAGLWAIWRDWVPFLSAIGDVSLWTYTDTVQGEPVTRAPHHPRPGAGGPHADAHLRRVGQHRRGARHRRAAAAGAAARHHLRHQDRAALRDRGGGPGGRVQHPRGELEQGAMAGRRAGSGARASACRRSSRTSCPA